MGSATNPCGRPKALELLLGDTPFSAELLAATEPAPPLQKGCLGKPELVPPCGELIALLPVPVLLLLLGNALPLLVLLLLLLLLVVVLLPELLVQTVVVVALLLEVKLGPPLLLPSSKVPTQVVVLSPPPWVVEATGGRQGRSHQPNAASTRWHKHGVSV